MYTSLFSGVCEMLCISSYLLAALKLTGPQNAVTVLCMWQCLCLCVLIWSNCIARNSLKEAAAHVPFKGRQVHFELCNPLCCTLIYISPMLRPTLYFIITFNHCRSLPFNILCFNILLVITFNVCWSFAVLILELDQFSSIFPLEAFFYVFFFALCIFSSWGRGMHIA